MELGVVGRGVDRALGIDADDLHFGLALVEVAADAGDRPAGADGDDDRVDLAAGLLPDLGRRDVVVRLPGSPCSSTGRACSRRGSPRRAATRRSSSDSGESWPTAVGVITTSAPYARSIEIFSWLILSGMTKMQPVALLAAARASPTPVLPGGRLDDRPARLELPVALGRLDHREADAVLDRAARVEVLELGEDARADPPARSGRAGRSVCSPTRSRTVGYSRAIGGSVRRTPTRSCPENWNCTRSQYISAFTRLVAALLVGIPHRRQARQPVEARFREADGDRQAVVSSDECERPVTLARQRRWTMLAYQLLPRRQVCLGEADADVTRRRAPAIRRPRPRTST